MIKMTGFVEIDRIIKQLPAQLNHTLIQQINTRALKPYVTAAYFAAPLLSGRTAKSIGVTKPGIKRAGSIGLVIAGPRRGRFGGNVAHFSEFGTGDRSSRSKTGHAADRGRMPRKPFLEPAWNRTKDQVMENVRVATGQVVYNFMKRTIKQFG
jgi:hypothetical protein